VLSADISHNQKQDREVQLLSLAIHAQHSTQEQERVCVMMTCVCVCVCFIIKIKFTIQFVIMHTVCALVMMSCYEVILAIVVF
jgi:hypothetical protein